LTGTDRLRGAIEVISAGAVLVGLIFVGVELRQNTAAVEAASLQEQTESSIQFLQNIASDPELTRIWMDGSTDRGQLDRVDARRHFLLVRTRWLRMQNAYRQWRRGTLNEEDWELYEGLICRSGTTADIQFESTWADHKPGLLEDFVGFVENCWSQD